MATAKRGYKLQQFLTHPSCVNCLRIGTKSSRYLISGGDDHKVNLWVIGQPNALLSLPGHTSSVESVALDPAEVLALSGASTGAIKLWDLEESKALRSIAGHRTSCSCIEFHPFGEFFASGYTDAKLRIWDIRRPGCIHTFGGHTRGIRTIKFTPDGRWVVSGGEDSTVKLWDLTAGRLLNDFKCHEGHIRCIDFHPFEFLLATGSVDRTVKFWDLETFELIGTAGPEYAGVYSIIFHPDGRTLFCGLDEGFKVLSWEPVIYHDTVDMGWSSLADLNIHDEKLLGCSYSTNCVTVWVADISLIEPYVAGCMLKHMEPKFDLPNESILQGGNSRFKTTAEAMRCNHRMRETLSGVAARSSEDGHCYPKRHEVIYPSKDIHLSLAPCNLNENSLSGLKKSSITDTYRCIDTLDASQQAVEPARVTRSISFEVEKASDSIKEISSSKVVISDLSGSNPDVLHNPEEVKMETKRLVHDSHSDISECNINGNDAGIKSTMEQFENILSPDSAASIPSKSCSYSSVSSQVVDAVKYVKGVAIQPGRTRSLVEKWERREICHNNVIPVDIFADNDDLLILTNNQKNSKGVTIYCQDDDMIQNTVQNHEQFVGVLHSRLTKLQVVRQFWERNDMKGSINAVRRLPDHAVQSDVVVILSEKSDLVTLDVFSCLLPLLSGLLDSKVDRFVSISLEMLLKLVRIFSPIIKSALVASPSVGVDIHADMRLECCKQCFIHLEGIKQNLHLLTRRGSSAKSAMELFLALQELC